MAIRIIPSQTVTFVPADNSVNILQSGSTLTSTGNAIDKSNPTNVSVIVGGTVLGGDNGVLLGGSFATYANNSLTVLETGVLVGQTFTGASIRGNNSFVLNRGEILGYGTIGVQVASGATVKVDNYGLIAAFDASGSFGSAVRLVGSELSILRNFGDLTSRNLTSPTVDSTAALGAVTIENHGTISSRDLALEDGSAAAVVINTGLIGGSAMLGSGDDWLLNSGQIQGDVSLGGNADVYRSTGGTVTGTVAGDAGDDTFVVDQPDLVIDGGADIDIVLARSDVLDVTGVETIRLLGAGNFSVRSSDDPELIQGNLGDNLLQGEDGNDTIFGNAGDDEIEGGAGTDEITGNVGDDLINAGADNDTVSGGPGSDTILGAGGEDDLNGGADNDVIDGGANDDTLSGFSGDDTLQGGDGADLLVGQDGNDSLDGGIAADVLDGGRGNDILEGGDGGDVLRGGTGNDSLDGGEGLDFLTGGAGADSFIFAEAAELTTGASRDQIIDFEQDVDVIDLSGLIDGTLGFVGTGPFTGANLVRLIETGTGSTIVQINLDADPATVEGEIRVANVIGLTADDFTL